MGLFASKSATPKFDGHFVVDVTVNQKNSTNKCKYSVVSSDLSKVTKTFPDNLNLVKFETELGSNDMYLLKDALRTKIGTDGDIEKLREGIIQILSNVRLQLEGKTFEQTPDLEYSVRVSATPLDAGLFYEYKHNEQLVHKITGTDLSPVTFAVESTGNMSMLQFPCSSEPNPVATLVSAGSDGDYQRNLPTIQAMIGALDAVLNPVKPAAEVVPAVAEASSSTETPAETSSA